MVARLSFALAVLTVTACQAPVSTRKCGPRQCSATQRCDLQTELCVQDSPPSVTLDPVPGVAVGPMQRLTGRATDDVRVERVEVSVDDGLTWSPAALTGDDFSVIVELPLLDLKALSVRARAFDSLGQRGETTDGFRVDDVGPDIALVAPRQAVRGPVVTLELEVADASGVQAVSADFGEGRVLDATFDGAAWRVGGPVPAVDGVPISIAVKATDDLGNASASRVSVTVDAVGPSGMFAAPAASALVSGTTLRVSGTVSDGTGVASVRVKVDGSASAAEATVTGATWVASLALPPENGVQHDLVATFTDTLGNSSQARLTVTVDNVAPQPALVEPLADALVATPELTVRLLAIGGAAAVSVSLGAQPAVRATAQGGDLWTAVLSVPTEDFTAETLSVVATDVAGNRGLASRSIQVDRVAPTLTIASPTPGQKLNAGSFARTDAVTVSFSAADGDPQLALEGFDGAAWQAGASFGVATSPTDNPRSYPVRARATDRAGNTTTLDWTFSVDRVAPTATVTPADGARNVEPRQVSVTFSEPVFGPTTVTEPLVLTPAAPMPGAWSPGHTSFTTAALSPYAVYQAALAASLVDDAGNPVAAAAPTRFHTAAAVPADGATLASGVEAFEASSNQDGVLLVAFDRGTPSAPAWAAYGWDPVTGAQRWSDEVPSGQAGSIAFHVLASRNVQPDLSAVAIETVSYTNLGGSFTQYSIGGVAQPNTRSAAVVPMLPMAAHGLDGSGQVGFISGQLYTRAPAVSVALRSSPAALTAGTQRWIAWGQDAAKNLTLEERACGYSPSLAAWSCANLSRSLPATAFDASAVVSPSGACEVTSTAGAAGRQSSSSLWSCQPDCAWSALTTRAAPGDHLQLAPFAGGDEDAVLGAWQLPANAGVQLGKLAASSCGGSFVPYGPALPGAIATFRPVQLGNRPALLYIDSAANLKVYAP